MTTHCTDPADVIVDTAIRAERPQRIWVGRCCHGTTSQGDSRDHAVEMTLEACALAHEGVVTIPVVLDAAVYARFEEMCRRRVWGSPACAISDLVSEALTGDF
jgi:hypothetical protein